MSNERRRFFRITDTIGISYTVLAASAGDSPIPQSDIFDLLTETDAKINRLLLDVAQESPAVAALVAAFNQKLERIANQLMLETRLLERVAQRVQEANISACGLAFYHDASLPLGTLLALELHLLPKAERVATQAVLVDCRKQNEGNYFWRLDFQDISPSQQDTLIQHLLERQRDLLKRRQLSDEKM